MDTATLLALAGAVNRLVAVLKPSVANLKLPDKTYDIVLQLIAIAAGILLAFITSANIIPAALNVSSLIGTIITGALIGLGSDILNGVLAFLYTGQSSVKVNTGGPTTVVPPPDSQ